MHQEVPNDDPGILNNVKCRASLLSHERLDQVKFPRSMQIYFVLRFILTLSMKDFPFCKCNKCNIISL